MQQAELRILSSSSHHKYNGRQVRETQLRILNSKFEVIMSSKAQFQPPQVFARATNVCLPPKQNTADLQKGVADIGR